MENRTLHTILGTFIFMLHPVSLESDTRNGHPTPPPNVTVKASSDLPHSLGRPSNCLPEAKCVQSASDV